MYKKKKLKRIPFFIPTHSTRQNNASGHQIITNNPQYQFFYNIHLTIIVNKRHYIQNLCKRIRFNDEKKMLKNPFHDINLYGHTFFGNVYMASEQYLTPSTTSAVYIFFCLQIPASIEINVRTCLVGNMEPFF